MSEGVYTIDYSNERVDNSNERVDNSNERASVYNKPLEGVRVGCAVFLS
jgi:hypothetical protein